MNTVQKTSFKVSTAMKQALRQNMILTGHSSRSKSRWIVQAIEMLLQADPALKSVGVGEDLERLMETEIITLPPSTTEKLDHAVLRLRRQDPTFEGPKSAILRAAIYYRLMQEDGRGAQF